MSYSRRQLYAMGETFGESATRREVGGKIIYGGGGGSPETKTGSTDIPDWVKPYAEESLGKAQALTSTPYQAYTGERVAQFTPLQQQAFGRAGEQQVAGQIGTGTGLAALAGASSFNDPGTAGSFMSPYMQEVVNQQMESAQRQADIAGTQRGAQAVRAGAFGGSRQAIENAEAARALASQKGQIQATGLQSAFDRAQQQFNQEQATRLGAAGQLGQLGQQQFGQEMGITGQQFGFGQQQRQATQDILNTRYQDFLNQQRAPYDQLSFMSGILRGTPMGQTQVSTAPGASTASQLIGLGTAAAGAYGAYKGAAAGGEVRSYAAGGGIAGLNQPELAAMAGGMSDQQLGQTAQMPSITDLAKMTLAAEAQQRADTRARALAQQAMAQQQPQGTVAQEQMAALEQGIGGLDVPDNLVGEASMAGGGIIAFSDGGSTWWEKELERMQEQGIDEAQRQAAGDARRQEFATFNAQLRNDPAQAKLRAEQQPRKDLRKGLDDPRMGLAGLTREGVQEEQRIADAVKASASAAAPTARAPGAAPTPAGIASILPKNFQDLQAQYRTEVKEAGEAGEKIEADRLAAIKRDQEELGQPGAEREKRLKATEKSLEGAEGKNLNMALIEAGLAIMSGNSANAFENIGKGAMVGTKAYTTGMNRIQERKDKLDEAVVALDELRYGDKKASKKELRDAEAAVSKAKQQTSAALAAVTGKEAEVAVDMYTKQLDRQATLAAASMRSAGGAGGENKLITAAEAAFQRDPEAAAIRKRLENPIGTINTAKANADLARLREIQAAKYKQYGITMDQGTTSTSAQDPLGLR